MRKILCGGVGLMVLLCGSAGAASFDPFTGHIEDDSGASKPHDVTADDLIPIYVPAAQLVADGYTCYEQGIFVFPCTCGDAPYPAAFNKVEVWPAHAVFRNMALPMLYIYNPPVLDTPSIKPAAPPSAGTGTPSARDPFAGLVDEIAQQLATGSDITTSDIISEPGPAPSPDWAAPGPLIKEPVIIEGPSGMSGATGPTGGSDKPAAPPSAGTRFDPFTGIVEGIGQGL